MIGKFFAIAAFKAVPILVKVHLEIIAEKRLDAARVVIPRNIFVKRGYFDNV